MEPYEPFFVEDPVRDEHALQDIPKLRQMTTVPLTHGEEWGLKWDFNRLVENHDVDFIRSTLPNVGGITEMMKVAGICETHAVGIIPHFTGPIATAGLVNCLSTFSGPVMLEYNYGGRPIDYLPQCLDFKNGKAYTNQRPGLGVTADMKLLTQIGEVTEPGVATCTGGRMGRSRIGRFRFKVQGFKGSEFKGSEGFKGSMGSAWLSALVVAPSRRLGHLLRHLRRQRSRIVLVGDSTVTDDSGWGAGFKQHVTAAVEVVNVAANGRSSKSYIDEGRWTEALAKRGDYYLIQFGHNDEPGKGPERETDPKTTYRANMARYVDDVRAIGAKPILITSLVRRIYNQDGTIRTTQTPYVEVVRALAAEKRVPLVDLHAISKADAEHAGDDVWADLSPRDDKGEVDRTHLNAKGSEVVARLADRGTAPGRS